MKLDHIVLQNFRQYFGQQKLIFSQDPKKNVTVIHGVNGAGGRAALTGGGEAGAT